VNTPALRLLGITPETKTMTATILPRNATGELTGEMPTPVSVNTIVRKLLPRPPISDVSTWLMEMQQRQHSMGLTSIRDLDLSTDAMRAYYNLWNQKKLTMRVNMGLELFAADWNQLEERFGDWGFGPGFGDHQLRVDTISEFALDSNASALMREPRLNGTRGEGRISPDQIRHAMVTMNRYGWRPAPHIAGDGTLDHVLAAYEAADADSSIRNKRWIVEHIPYVQPDQIQKIARLGVMVSSQFQGRQGTAGAARALGPERANRIAPLRDLLDHRIIVSAGSDWSGGPNYNPFENIYFYVTRKAEDGSVVNAAQKISREEALRMATINNAYFTFEEDVKGSLEPGKLADFVILSDDLMTIPEERILEVKPLATYVGGRKVYSAPQSGF
jgi:predicted amidohydrolase YtcJ